MSVTPKRGRTVFEKLERDLIKLRAKPRAENVHGIRTGTRRLEILLHDLSPNSGRSDRKLLKQLGRIRKRAGKVRDLDVQLAALRTFKTAREPRRKTQLVNYLIGLRERQEKKLRKVLNQDSVREIRKRLKRAAKDFKPADCRDPLLVARKMLSQIDSSAAASEEVLHRFRILAKRARYAAEFAEPSTESEGFVAGVKRVQDALGDWHDWMTLTRSANGHLGEVHDSPLVAELHNITGAKFRRAAAELAHLHPKVGSAHKKPAPTAAPSPASSAAGPVAPSAIPSRSPSKAASAA
jgi:CHAD domain-containing protein